MSSFLDKVYDEFGKFHCCSFKEYGKGEIVFIEVYPLLLDSPAKRATSKQIELIGKLINNVYVYKSVKWDRVSCLQASIIIQLALKYPRKMWKVKL